MNKRRNNLRITAIMQEQGLTLPDLAERLTTKDKHGNVRKLTSAAIGARINVYPSEFKIQTICPSCGAKISASVTAE